MTRIGIIVLVLIFILSMMAASVANRVRMENILALAGLLCLPLIIHYVAQWYP